VPPRQATEAEIRDWCTREIAQLLEMPPDEIGPDVKFARLGLDSANAVQLILTLEERLGVELDPELVSEYPTVAALAREVAAIAGGKTDR
jgi:acyl carrier protein